ncbi:hypothetical protein NDU88_002606 [Pleurodeles waltl]|uniref:Secreted protein n=1 Tax=Pleurodeles waltl TaxID=8319 RepID=A0AAV7WQP0_PLEWA|nr:hypothetical protein NDU88_002606 [Pleurodeles waltl]
MGALRLNCLLVKAGLPCTLVVCAGQTRVRASITPWDWMREPNCTPQGFGLYCVPGWKTRVFWWGLPDRLDVGCLEARLSIGGDIVHGRRSL